MAMHDVSVAERILDAVKDCKGLRTVFVLVGRDSCVRADMLERSFDAAKRGTPQEAAKLVVVPGPGEDITVISVEVDDDARA
jgi:Zn finger protein HypA/HybF involved in hydrogenase expression